MPVLENSKHERVAQAIVAGQTAGQAYGSVYGQAKGADQSASRLLRNAKISARIAELRSKLAEKLLESTTLTRQNRLKALETRHKLLMRVVDERGEALGQLNIHGYPLSEPKEDGEDHETDGTSSTPAPGASTGLVCLDFRGKDGDRAIWKVDTGLLAELRAIEAQTREELGEDIKKVQQEVTGKDGGPLVITVHRMDKANA